jgi:hypothetical protein
MTQDDLQQRLFQEIKTKLPSNISLAEEIADLLSISTDSAYRRIRSEKLIGMDELQKLCQHYSVSIDHLFQINTNSIVFFGNWADVQTFDFEKYLDDMLLQLQAILSAAPGKMYFEAKDIPPFHHFQFEHLAAFKYFFWMKSILQYPEFTKTYFEDTQLQQKLKTTGRKIIQAYSMIPSVEIWSVETINSSIRQIEFYRESGVFRNPETINNLYDDLSKLVDHIEAQAACGEKFVYGDTAGNGTSFELYFNEVILGHNTIFAETSKASLVFINHGVLNYMITRDKNFCTHTKKSMENIMRKSSPISRVSEKERNRFFQALREKISKRRKNNSG